jgi:signal transduction histidine kinase
MEKRRDFFLIFKEAIHNIIKHSGATTAWIEIAGMAHSLRMTVRDDGKGFADKGLSEGNGLKNMKMRAAQSGAKLHISSALGSGTTITLEMKW